MDSNTEDKPVESNEVFDLNQLIYLQNLLRKKNALNKTCKHKI